MNPNANQKKWTVIAACVVAAGILGATLYVGGGGGPSGGRKPVVILDPNDLPGQAAGSASEGSGKGLEIRKLEEGRQLFFSADSFEPIEGGSNYVEMPVVRVFFEGRRQHLELRADRGTVYMPSDNPRSGRLSGNVWLTFFEPEQAGAYPDWDDVGQVTMHLRLDDADFDLERGEIFSRSPLHLYTRTSEFHGVGLRLVFNQLRNRLEHLRIDKGDFLRVYQGPTVAEAEVAAPQAPGSTSGATAQANSEATANAASNAAPNASPNAEPASEDPAVMLAEGHADPSAEPNGGRGKAKAGAGKAGEVAQKPAEPEEPDQYYEATFETDVRIDSKHNAYALRGDVLTLLFGVEPDASDDGGAADPLGTLGLAVPVKRGGKGGRGGGLGDWPVTSSRSAAYSAIAPGSLSSIAQQGPEDVYLYWSGPMVIRPNPNKPAELKDVKDLYVRLSGQRTTLTTDDGAAVTGAALAYTRSSETIRVQRSDAQAVELYTPEQGRIVGGDLWVEGATGRGEMAGPLQIQAASGWETASAGLTQDPLSVADAGGPVEGLSGEPSGIPSGSGDTSGGGGAVLGAEGGMTFAFFGGEDAGAGRASGPGLSATRALKQVTFFDAVRVEDPRMTAEADGLRLAFVEVDAETSRLSGITAEGSVTVMGLDGEGAEPAWISGDWVSLSLAGEGDGLAPKRLLARGEVTVSNAELLLDTQRLDARFEPVASSWESLLSQGVSADASGRAPGAGAGGVRLVEVWAFDGVEAVVMVAEGEGSGAGERVPASVSGERLLLLPETERLTVLAGPDRAATLMHDGAVLTGPVVGLNGLERRAAVWGAGEASVPLAEGDTEAAAGPDGELQAGTEGAGDGPGVFSASWLRGMAFSEGDGFGALIGDAAGRRQTRLEKSLMSGDLIRLQLAKPVKRGGVWSALDQAESAARSARPLGGGVQRVIAIGGGEVFGQQLPADRFEEDGQDAVPVGRIWIQGQRIVADVIEQTLTVPTGGVMLIEDYSDWQGPGAAGAQRVAAGAGVAAVEPVAEALTINAQEASGPGKLTGQGATTLTWVERMHLNAETNDAVLEGNVVMTHAALLPSGALDYDNKANLRSDVLKVDVVETGGLAALNDQAGAQPQVRGIACDGAVRLAYGSQRVEAAYLRYEAAEESVWFTAAPGGRVRIDDVERGTGFSSRWVKWSLPTNTFTGEPAGPTIVPLVKP